ncbi:MAG: hypothetical protein ACO1TE_16520 [Prosthecobacter sp.]
MSSFSFHSMIAGMAAAVAMHAGALLAAIPGDLDHGFGTGGGVVTPMGAGGDAMARAIAVQADGKVLVAGHARNATGDSDFALARYTTAGELDTTFGSGGKVLTSIGSGEDRAFDMVVQGNGSIVVAGYSFNGTHNDFAVVRYTSAGVLDSTFSGDGKVTTTVGTNINQARRVALQSDGKIVVAGLAFTGTDFDMAVVRYTSAGALDTTFSSDGIVTVDIGGSHDQGEGLIVQGTSKITVCGMSHNGTSYDAAVVRLNASNGGLDSTFSGDGKLTTALGSGDTVGWDMALTTDGKYVVAGEAWNGSDRDIALMRYTSTGVLDGTFGTGGTVMTGSWRNEYALGVVLQPDGKILTSGPIDYLGSSFLLMRFTTSGGWDETFNRGDPVITSFESGVSTSLTLALQGDGRILSAGYVVNAGLTHFALMRHTVHISASATTLAAADVTTGGATLRGFVNPNGAPSTAAFEYGTSTAYGSTASVTLTPANGTEEQYVTAPLTGLLGNTTYHYRLKAQTGAYAEYGEDMTFTTPASVEIHLYAGPDDTAPELTDGQAEVLDFGSTPLGQPVARLFTVKNSGSTSLQLSAPVLSTGWELGTGAFTSLALPGGGSHTFEVRFLANTVKGVFNGSLALPSDDADEPVFDFGFKAKAIIGGSPTALDTSFNLSGKVTTPMRASGWDEAHAVALQADGKIVVAGTSNNSDAWEEFALARYHPNGTLDTTFGTGGKVITDVDGVTSYAWDVVVQPDGKIVVCGSLSYSSSGLNPDFVVVRYTSSGALDTAFNGNGKVILDVSPNSPGSQGWCLALQSDGKIVAAGNGDGLALIRLHTNGTLDSSFGSGGKVSTSMLNGRIWGLAMLADGRIVVGGGCTSYTPQQNNDFVLARYTSTGALDTTFGGTGYVFSQVSPGNDFARGMALQPDGKVIVAGYYHNGTNYDFAMVRHLADGALDTAFGTNGVVKAPVGTGTDECYSVLVQADGGILLAGRAQMSGSSHFTLLRHTSSGALDTSFGAGGVLFTPVGTSSAAYDMVEQPDGKLIVVGMAGGGGNYDFALVRHGADHAPSVVTNGATSVTPASASIGGSVNPNGVITTYWFQHGTTPAYGSTTAPQTAGHGTEAVFVSASLTDLTPGATHYYRLVAQTGESTMYGEGRSFTTMADNTPPSGGFMTAPGSVVAGSTFTVSFSGWMSPRIPLVYTVRINDAEVSAGGSSSSRQVTAPSSAGTYILKGWITDNALNTTEVTRDLVVTAAESGFASAVAAAGLSGPNAAPEATPFHDGVANLLKFAFNMNLAGPDSGTMAAGGTQGLPRLTRTPPVGSAGIFRFEFLRRTDGALGYTPQMSSDLLNPSAWQPLTSTPTVTPVSAGWERVVYEEFYDAAATRRCFGRVQVTQAP